MPVAALLACALAQAGTAGLEEASPALAEAFAHEVDKRLQLPAQDAADYAGLLREALRQFVPPDAEPQFAVLVDRSPQVQAVMLYWGSTADGWELVGASPASTGLPGRYEHFATPLGVFRHSPANPDFRAEGTRNEFGIRGYGRKGSRVYDFGWVPAAKGWGNRAMSVMRLQMHATDPDILEPRLGSAQSKGCVRIPASLNEFLDRHGVLDADYDELLSAGRRPWVLRADRQATGWAGRWLVIVDTWRLERPTWSPAPASGR